MSRSCVAQASASAKRPSWKNGTHEKKCHCCIESERFPLQRNSSESAALPRNKQTRCLTSEKSFRRASIAWQATTLSLASPPCRAPARGRRTEAMLSKPDGSGRTPLSKRLEKKKDTGHLPVRMTLCRPEALLTILECPLCSSIWP